MDAARRELPGGWVAIRDGLPGCVQLVFLRCLAQKLRWNGNAYASAL